MTCSACGSGMFVNGAYWQCPNGHLMPLKQGYTPDTAVELIENQGHWYFVRQNGHLLTINSYTRWPSQEAAIAAITEHNAAITEHNASAPACS
jgi:hypothetical protein